MLVIPERIKRLADNDGYVIGLGDVEGAAELVNQVNKLGEGGNASPSFPVDLSTIGLPIKSVEQRVYMANRVSGVIYIPFDKPDNIKVVLDAVKLEQTSGYESTYIQGNAKVNYNPHEKRLEISPGTSQGNVCILITFIEI